MSWHTVDVEDLPDFQPRIVELVRHVYRQTGRPLKGGGNSMHYNQTRVSHHTEQRQTAYVNIAEGHDDAPGARMVYSVNAKTRKIKQKLSGDAYVLLNTDKFDMLLDELTAHVHPGQRSLSATSPAVQSPNRRRPRPPSPDPYDIDTVMDIEYDRQAEAAYAEHQAQERKRRREHLHESVAAAQQSVQQPAQIQQHPDAQAEPALPQHGQKSAPLAAASHTSLGQHQSSAQPAGSDSSAGKSGGKKEET